MCPPPGCVGYGESRGFIDRWVLRDERLLIPPGPEGSNGTEPSSGAAKHLAIDEAVMSYVVLARKWRPQKFSDLVGQEAITKTLQNAIELERVSHALLFTGSRGVGKTTSARILAKGLNCEKGPTVDPCDECSNCKEIVAGSSVDVFEVDGASNTKVDEIRELLENVQYRPSKSRHKIYIIDEVHMLSTHSFNALLKTLEEPPPGVIFIFATTEPHKIPDTILSRCQRFDFKQISQDRIAEHLKVILKEEKISFTDASIHMVSKQAAGSLRDALSHLDQVIAFSGDKISDEDVASVLGLTDRELVLKSLEAFFQHDAIAGDERVGRSLFQGIRSKKLPHRTLGSCSRHDGFKGRGFIEFSSPI